MCSWELWCIHWGYWDELRAMDHVLYLEPLRQRRATFPAFTFQKRTRVFRGEQKTARTSVLNLAGPSGDRVYLERRRSHFLLNQGQTAVECR